MALYVEAMSEVGCVENPGEVGRSPKNLIDFVSNIPRLHQLAQIGWQSIDRRGAVKVATEISILIPKKIH
ncbi:MAG: hypothetical protein WBA57_08520 [Elainellaceae cyanobacterium]